MFASVIAISPDSSQLAVGGLHWGVSLWNLETSTLQTRIDVESDITSLAYSPDGQTLVSGGGDSAVRLWDTVSGRLLSTLYAHADSVNGVDFSPDGTALATAGLEGDLRLWKAATLEEIDKHPLTLRSLLDAANTCLERHYFMERTAILRQVVLRKQATLPSDRPDQINAREALSWTEDQLGGAPKIMPNPRSLRLAPGQSAEFYVGVSRYELWSYQWFHNGVRIDGANEST